MLVACRLAGLCALEAHRAGGSAACNPSDDAARRGLTRFAEAANWPGFRASPRSVRDGPCLVVPSARASALGWASAGRSTRLRRPRIGLLSITSLGVRDKLNTAWIGLASRHVGPALPASTYSSMQRGSAAMLKPPVWDRVQVQGDVTWAMGLVARTATKMVRPLRYESSRLTSSRSRTAAALRGARHISSAVVAYA
jgi:hypothetical protein